jgi:hypothetical protein
MAQKSFNHFAKIAAAIPPAAAQVVRKTAFDAQGHIQGQIRANDQVDTGFMIGSVYVQTSDESTYKGGAKALPEVARPGNETTAHVAVAAKYAVPQNYGTAYMPGRPFFEPGMERTRAGFEKALALIKIAMEKAAA